MEGMYVREKSLEGIIWGLIIIALGIVQQFRSWELGRIAGIGAIILGIYGTVKAVDLYIQQCNKKE